MAVRLTDAQVARIRQKAAEPGANRADLAAEFGVSRRHVDRLVRGDQRQTIAGADGADGPALTAVRAYLGELELDAAGRVLEAGAEALAAKLDSVRVSDSAASAAATPGLVRQLGDTLRQIRGDEADALEQLREMLLPLRGAS